MGAAFKYDYDRPWERQPFDVDDRLWALFQEFLTIPLNRNGQRSLAKLRERGVSLTLFELENIAHTEGWQLRAKARDEYLDNLRASIIETVVRESAEETALRFVKANKKIAAIVDLESEKVLKMSAANEIPLLSHLDLIRYQEKGLKLDRLMRGEATETTSVSHDLSRLSDDELETLRALQKKVSIES